MIQTKLLLIGGFTLIATLEQGYALANPPLTLPERQLTLTVSKS
jgi:hypothetical protein